MGFLSRDERVPRRPSRRLPRALAAAEGRTLLGVGGSLFWKVLGHACSPETSLSSARCCEPEGRSGGCLGHPQQAEVTRVGRVSGQGGPQGLGVEAGENRGPAPRLYVANLPWGHASLLSLLALTASSCYSFSHSCSLLTASCLAWTAHEGRAGSPLVWAVPQCSNRAGHCMCAGNHTGANGPTAAAR